MRLTSIELENFRCFEKERIDFHPQLNVFVGMNASGKTALLEGIGLGLGMFLKHLYGHRSGIRKSDIRQETKSGTARLSMPVGISLSGLIGPSNEQRNWALRYGTDDAAGISNTFKIIVDDISRKIFESVNIELPVLLYFSTQRLWGGDDSALQSNDALFQLNRRITGYFESLSKKSNTLFFEKEIDKEQKASQQSKDLHYDFDDSRLNLIRSLAGKVIEDCEIFYFDYEKESLAVKFKDGKRLTLNELSDGQRSLLLISTGIAFQCATLNPYMGLDAYKSQGVVLIDEVELHLHPDWQRRILPILIREFPNLQFIATTHSPQVLSTIDGECVHVIKDFHVHPLQQYTLGRDSNSILSEVFGIEERPKEYADKLQHFYSLLKTETVAEAERAFEELESLWGGMDTEIVRARMFLEDLYDDVARAKEKAK
jgi:predicted ATP-binding protein involved in virulence